MAGTGREKDDILLELFGNFVSDEEATPAAATLGGRSEEVETRDCQRKSARDVLDEQKLNKVEDPEVIRAKTSFAPHESKDDKEDPSSPEVPQQRSAVHGRDHRSSPQDL